MEKWKLPPMAKIYEALSAVADGRVTFVSETSAEVASSSRDKTYRVSWREDFTQITSNDNASHWQGYLGYPIIAVLLAAGRLDLNRDIAQHLAGIPWKIVNRQFRNDYDRAVESVLLDLKDNDVDVQAIRDEVQKIMVRLSRLDLEKLPGKTRKVKGSS
jgi:hypothetical protein